MSYECSRCSHPDWAHSCSFCRHCIEQCAHHEFTVEKKDGDVHLHGKLTQQQPLVAHDWETANGSKCTPDCPACRLLRVRAAEQREKIKAPPREVVLTENDRKFLAAQKISW